MSFPSLWFHSFFISLFIFSHKLNLCFLRCNLNALSAHVHSNNRELASIIFQSLAVNRKMMHYNSQSYLLRWCWLGCLLDGSLWRSCTYVQLEGDPKLGISQLIRPGKDTDSPRRSWGEGCLENSALPAGTRTQIQTSGRWWMDVQMYRITVRELAPFFVKSSALDRRHEASDSSLTVFVNAASAI